MCTLFKKRKSGYPSGSFTTGCCDVHIGHGESSILFRMFYPTDLNNIDDHSSDWANWYLGSKYLDGLAKRYMPPLLEELYKILGHQLTHSSLVPSVKDAPIAQGTFPVIIFSHGLAANRSCYSTICSDLASHGFIVVAIEHRDGSASATFKLQKTGDKTWVKYKTLRPKQSEFDLRFKQVQIRSRECTRLLDIMNQLNVENNLKNELPSNFDLRTLENRMDLTKPVIAGHSFGGATTILTLSMDKRFNGGICLDPWLFPLEINPDDKLSCVTGTSILDSLHLRINQPILFILMECFQYEKNLKALKKYQNERNIFWTVLKAVHQNQTDSALMFRKDPIITQIMVGCYSRIPPKIAMNLNNKLMINFVNEIQDCQKPFTDAYEKYISEKSNWLFAGARGTGKPPKTSYVSRQRNS